MKSSLLALVLSLAIPALALPQSPPTPTSPQSAHHGYLDGPATPTILEIWKTYTFIPAGYAIYTAAPAPPPAPTGIIQITDWLLFLEPIEKFLAYRNKALQNRYDEKYRDYDWNSDACLVVPDRPFGYDFKGCCIRHDFGYRNYKRQHRFNENTKKNIDELFLADMNGVCAWKKHKVPRNNCYNVAKLYYKAVRKWGKRDVGVMKREIEDEMERLAVETKMGMPDEMMFKTKTEMESEMESKTE